MTMIKKTVSEIQEDDIIMVNDLPCKVLAVELSPTGKTAKVFYAINGDANFLRCSINSKLTIAPEDKPSNVVMFRKSFPESKLSDMAPQASNAELSEFYKEMFEIVSREYKEIHDFYLKHILGMPALVRKSIEITLTETNSAKQHLQEKHLKELGFPMERTEKSD